VEKEADTFIIIYGLPRTGKTTLGFHLLIHYLRLKRRLYEKGKSEWKPENRWSILFKKYFAGDAEDMSKKIMRNPRGSFCFVDEGLDVVSWHHMLEREQKELLELIQKTGEKGMLTILITPSMSLLTKSILARAHYLFIIPDEPTKDGNVSLIFKNWKIPFLAEKNPFGLQDIIDKLVKHPILAEEEHFFDYLKSRRRYMGSLRFKPINRDLYELYRKLVKEPSIMRVRKKRKMVSYARYFKLRYAFETILWRLHNNDGKSFAQIERLLTDKFGNKIISRQSIISYINRISMMEKPPELSDEEIIEVEKKEEKFKDLTLEELESVVDGEEEA